ncbi:hypothetical protein MASR1M60_17930 [Rhodocyclaceae bacterium]
MQAAGDLKARHAAERAALKTAQQAFRHEELKPGLFKGKGAEANKLRSVIAAIQAGEKITLRERQTQERTALQAQHPNRFPRFEDWLRAKVGHEQADAYRYKNSPTEQPGRIYAARDIRDYSYVMSLGSAVKYRAKDAGFFSRAAFVDRGRRIDVIDTKNPASVLAALQLGQQKFGKVTLTGPAEFQVLCVRLAVQHGITIENPDLQAVVVAARAERWALEKKPIQNAPSFSRSEPETTAQPAIASGNPAIPQPIPTTVLSPQLGSPTPQLPLVNHSQPVTSQPAVSLSPIAPVISPTPIPPRPVGTVAPGAGLNPGTVLEVNDFYVIQSAGRGKKVSYLVRDFERLGIEIRKQAK